MIKLLRALLRLFCFAIVTVAVVLLFCVGLLVNGAPKRRVRWKNRVISRWAAMVARILNIQLHICGPRPQPPFFLVSNHLSYLDILPFWSVISTTFVAKGEIADWPFFGFVANILSIIFINRSKKKDLQRVNAAIEERQRLGDGVILFPEGTSSKGARVLAFKSSLLQFPAAHQLPVYYASISYHVPESEKATAANALCWWGDMEFIRHFWRLLKLKESRAEVVFGEEPIQMNDRKELSAALQQKIEAQFVPSS